MVYTGLGKLLDESQGARYIDHGDWETYIIYDVYMKTGIVYILKIPIVMNLTLFYEVWFDTCCSICLKCR